MRYNPKMISISGLSIINNATGATNIPANTPTIPSGTNNTRTINVDKTTARIFNGSTRRNIPVLKIIAKTFKKINARSTINKIDINSISSTPKLYSVLELL
jgi:hypothetical protein